ncbi:MAG TPA: oligosaccharide flippase family protein [Pyrinomonadaceae bacterium]|nr:oligosaccharide flippase family protein [Pyrinomonadaceae bacterium]
MEDRQSETGKSIFRNVLWGFSTWILPIGLSFIATPIIVKSLGDKDYGIYALVLGFVGYSFNFSFGRAITKYIAEFRAKGENEKIPDLFSSALFINLAVGLLSVSIICFLANWLVLFVLKIDAESQSKSITAIYIASAIIFFSMLSQIFNSVLQGIHRFDVYSKIFNLNNLTLLSGNLVLAVLGYKLLSLFVWNLSVTCLTCVIFAISAKRLLPEVKLNFKFQPETLKLIVKYSYGVIGYQILSNFLLLFERGWIFRKLGAENLTYYVVPMTLAIYIHAFISSLIIVIFPLASELKTDNEKLLRLYTKATKIVVLLVVFLGTTIIIKSRFFLSLWIGAEFADKTWMLLTIHTITFSLVAIQAVSWLMTEGLGYPNYNFLLFLVCLVISVSLMVGLTPSLGNLGISIGRMAGYAAIFLSIFYVERWFFKKVQAEFWMKVIGILAVSSTASALTERFIIQSYPQSWLVLAAATVGGAFVYFFMAWTLGFVSEDEKLLFKRLLSR